MSETDCSFCFIDGIQFKFTDIIKKQWKDLSVLFRFTASVYPFGIYELYSRVDTVTTVKQRSG
jgi:hypothetical protein